MYIRVCMCMYVYVYIHTYMYICVYMKVNEKAAGRRNFINQPLVQKNSFCYI